MKQFVSLVTIIGTLLSTTLAAPWVVLDSRSDMLAMSSEVSDSAVAYALPPPGVRFNRNNEEDAVASILPERVSENKDDDAPIPMTTEEQSLADQTTAPVLKLTDSKLVESEPQVIQDEIAQTTVTPITDDDVPEVTAKQQDVPELTTTMPTAVSSSTSVEALLEEDIQSKDMNIQVMPDEPIAPQRQNPNVIDQEEPLTAVVVNKKKHGIFNGKKSKFSL